MKEEEDDDVEEDPEEPEEEVIVTTTNEVQETAEVKTEGVSSVDEHVSGDDQQISVTEETKEVLISKETEDGIVVVKEETKEVTVTEGEKVEPSEEEPLQETGNATEDDEQSPDDSTVVSRRMEVPNNKVSLDTSVDLFNASMLWVLLGRFGNRPAGAKGKLYGND